MPSTNYILAIEKNIKRLHTLYETVYNKELSAFIEGVAEEITLLQTEVKTLSKKRKGAKNGTATPG